MLDTKETVTLLGMAKVLMENYPLTTDAYAIGRDLYDLAIRTTSDKTIAFQAEDARRHGYNRLKCISYLKYRLNLPIHG